MFTTGYDRMCCILDGYTGILKAYNRDLVFLVDARYYLAKNESYFYIKAIPESLHNLNSQPDKAYQVIGLLKQVLSDTGGKGEEISFLKTLLRQQISYIFHN